MCTHIFILSVVAATCWSAYALPLETIETLPNSVIPIIEQSHSSEPDGSFKFSYVTGNGIKVESSGFMKKTRTAKYNENGEQDGEQDVDSLVQVGSYSYPSPDGTIITLNYIADENGFQPQGEHLPTPPPVPESVRKALVELSQSENGQVTKSDGEAGVVMSSLAKIISSEIDMMMVSTEDVKIDEEFLRTGKL